MDYKEIKKLADKYFEGNTSLEEEQLLREIFNSQEIADEELQSLNFYFNSIDHEKKIKYHHKPGKKRKLVYISLSTAASILMLFGFFLLLNNPSNELNQVSKFNSSDKALKVEISKHVQVWLNKGGELSYFTSSSNTNIFDLKGEAYFEFSIDGDFKILTNENVIAINTPTHVNIKSTADNNTGITVSKGCVALENNRDDNGLALLVPKGNLCAVNNKLNMAYSTSNPNENYLAWKTGELIFSNTPLATVSDILSEHYQVNLEILNHEVALCLFSGNFKNKSIEQILTSVSKELNVKIENDNNRILLTGTNCYK